MEGIEELYQELILDHAKAPKNFCRLSEKSHSANGHNPLCGDHLMVDVLVENNQITKISFFGEGCAISKASASLMSETVKGLSLDQTRDVFKSFHEMLTCDGEISENLKKCVVFAGVKQFPMRVKCATLCWHTLAAALEKSQSSVCTE